MQLRYFKAFHCDDLNYSYLQILALAVTFVIFAQAPKLVQSQCNNDEWDCDDGECIDSTEVCDGVINCKDGSDEIVENCMGTTCPQFAFRCAYGGCVAGNFKCNKRKDCADNSDEVTALCAKHTEIQELERQLKGNCSDNSMQCKSGECIENIKRCDGQIDCRDASDETVELCSVTSCPQFAFRCGYGGCINGKQKCDGRVDCIDGSDEASSLCGTTRNRGERRKDTTTTTTSSPTRTSSVMTSSTTTTQRSPFLDMCQLPTDPHMIIQDYADQYLTEGALVRTNTIVRFQCLPSYTLLGQKNNFCSRQQWRYALPKCQKFCNASELFGLSTTVRCEQDGGQIPCGESVPPETNARFGCASGFSLPQPNLNSVITTCLPKGVWDYPRFRCQMRCGNVAPPTTKFSRGGAPVNITETPWHVGIYSKFRGPFIHICGGTIIAPRLVISAAHCFWNEANSRLFDKSYYNAVAGKYYREYDNENEFVERQARNISEFYMDPAYNDRNENYKSDIIVLRLDRHLVFTASIRPICIEFLQNARKEVETGLMGKFAGWGITETQQASEVLQSVTMKAISNAECRRELNQVTDYDLPDDKFCLKDEYGKSACRGDSGGGFVRAQRLGTETYYFLIGIISHAPIKEQDCARNGLVALTNVNYFDTLIEELKRNEIKDF